MKKHIFIRLIILCLLYSILCFGCASSVDEDLETARFALDAGDWDTAIKHANAVLSEDRSNIDAALLLASAYAGKSGVKALDVFEKIATYANRKSMFKTVHDAVTERDTAPYNRLYLRDGIVALTERLRPLPDEYDEDYLDHLFKTAVLLAIEIYATPSTLVQPFFDGIIDPSKITDEIKDLVKKNFIDSDEKLIKYGFKSTDDPVKQIRYTYCQLKMASGDDSGFEKEALQDLLLCQLSDDPDSLSKDNGDLHSPNISTCKDLEFDECEDAGPVE